jgi:hypothetical protein
MLFIFSFFPFQSLPLRVQGFAVMRSSPSHQFLPRLASFQIVVIVNIVGDNLLQ